MLPNNPNNPNNIDNTDIYKILNKIYKLQDDQQKTRQEETSILSQHLEQMNILLSKLGTTTNTNINIAEFQKPIPYSRSNTINIVQTTKPPNPDEYTEIINIYRENNSRPIQYMTLINDGPGNIYFIVGHVQFDLSTQETLLNVNDTRELFNVYEIRLRVTQPLTSYRLVEGIFRTGSFAPATKANTEIRPTLQSNEILKIFDAIFDNPTTPITITSPTTQTLSANYAILPAFQVPLPPGKTATFVDSSTGLVMPYLIPSGFILEAFAYFGNTSTECTLRVWVEPLVNSANFFGTQTFVLESVLPFSSRGTPFNFVPNINFYSTQFIDHTGAPFFDMLGNPAPGRYALFTITNDDPFNSMVGDPFFVAILRRLT